MQKLRFVNANGDEIDFTDFENFGVTSWDGLDKTNLDVQSQTSPFQDGSVFLDAVLQDRDLSFTVCINDKGDLKKRYELKRFMIHVLNPKLGEGILTYTNDYISKRIKVIPQTPVFPTKNMNNSGTAKASVTFTACDPYWEDIEESNIFFTTKNIPTIKNEGDVPAQMNIEFFSSHVVNPSIIRINDNSKITYSGELDSNLFISTETGHKRVFTEQMKFKTTNYPSLRSITYSFSLGIFVAVGDDNVVLTSYDSVEWKFQTRPTTNVLNSVTYSENLGLFVAVGQSGTIITSSDGINWTVQTSPTTYILSSVTYSEDLNLFVAVGLNGTILTSSDGINWAKQTSHLTNNLNSVTYSKNLNLFVAVGLNGTVLTSSDGITWTLQTSPTTYDLNSVTYSKNLGLFVAVGNEVIITSSDGINWTEQTSPKYQFLNSVTYSEDLNLFVAVGQGGTIITSSDGINWTVQTSPTYQILRSVTYSEKLSLFVAVGLNGTIVNSYFSEQENQIQNISPDSNMNLNLLVGENKFRLLRNSGDFSVRIRYRQKYIGV